MKIIFLVNKYPPKWISGTELTTFYVAEQMKKRGHEVHVVTSLDEGLPDESCEEGIHIHRLSSGGIRFVGTVLFWVKMVKAIQKINPDIVHVQSFLISIPALFSKKIFNVPFVVSGMGSDVYKPNWFIKKTIKIVLKNADSVVALTENMKQEMEKIHRREIFIIPSGIDLGRFYQESPYSKRKEEPKIILFVGRLSPVKGVQYLIRAFKIVEEKIPDVKLFLVGEGEDKESLLTLTNDLGITDSVIFFGMLPIERIPVIMNRSHIFVLPSLSEGMGLVTLEAMACGLPIIASNVGGLPDIIEEGLNGYLVKAKSPEEIADRILLLLQNKRIREKISANNTKKAEFYSWNKIAESLENKDNSILNKKM